MRVLAIDPGYEQSAYVLYDGAHIPEHAIEANAMLHGRICGGLATRADVIVFEQIEAMGMAVGREVFETVFWTGRLFEAARQQRHSIVNHAIERMPRRTVKVHLCHSARAQDSNIRVALIDRFGGTKAAAIGTTKSRGPLYGIKSHEWAALAIAVTWWDMNIPATERNQHESAPLLCR